MRKVLILTDDISLLPTSSCRGLILVRVPDVDINSIEDTREKVIKQVNKEARKQHANAVMDFKVRISNRNVLTAYGTAIWLTSEDLPADYKA